MLCYRLHVYINNSFIIKELVEVSERTLNLPNIHHSKLVKYTSMEKIDEFIRKECKNKVELYRARNDVGKEVLLIIVRKKFETKVFEFNYEEEENHDESNV